MCLCPTVGLGEDDFPDFCPPLSEAGPHYNLHDNKFHQRKGIKMLDNQGKKRERNVYQILNMKGELGMEA